jgi:hypothetical protein
LKIARKAAREAELKNLTAEIEADKKKIAENPKGSYNSLDRIKSAQDKALYSV